MNREERKLLENEVKIVKREVNKEKGGKRGTFLSYLKKKNVRAFLAT